MYDVIVIGAGPTGASAAIFTAKAGKHTLLIDHNQSVTRRAWIENHYGVKETSGPDLVETGIHQAEHFGAKVILTKVVRISTLSNGLQVITENGTYTAHRVLLATGLNTELAEASGITTKPGTEPRVKTVVEVTPEGKTSMDGVYAAGAIAGTSLHTIITAGDGAKVAVNIISELNGTRYVDHDALKVLQK